MNTKTNELLKPQAMILGDINGGYEYQDGDVLNADVVNRTLESVGYMQNLVDNLKQAPDITCANSVGTAEVKIMPDGRFQFKNLKGEAGAGTVVSVENEAKLNLSFNSDPQTQIDSKTAVLDHDGNAIKIFDTRAKQPQLRVGSLGGDGFYTCNMVCNYMGIDGYQRYTIDLGVKAGIADFIHGTVQVTCSGTFYNFNQSYSTVKLLDMDLYHMEQGSYLHIPKIEEAGVYRIGDMLTLPNGNLGFYIETNYKGKCSQAYIQLLITSRGNGWNPTVTQEIIQNLSLPRPMYPHCETKIYDKDRADMNWGYPSGIGFRAEVPYDFKGYDYLKVNISGNTALEARNLVLIIDLLNCDTNNWLYINSVAGIYVLGTNYGLIAAECFVNNEKTKFTAHNVGCTFTNSTIWYSKNDGDSVITTIFGGKY